MIEEIIFIAIVFLSFMFSFFLIREPDRIFKIQQRIYRMINWHIEPISLEKERRNTRWMGMFMLIVTAAAVLYKMCHA